MFEEYEGDRRVVYGEGLTFVPKCPNCGRYVKADESILANEYEGPKEPNAIFKDPQFIATPGMWGWDWKGYNVSRLYEHPTLKDASGADFRLRPSSPCIDRGVLIRGM